MPKVGNYNKRERCMWKERAVLKKQGRLYRKSYGWALQRNRTLKTGFCNNWMQGTACKGHHRREESNPQNMPRTSDREGTLNSLVLQAIGMRKTYNESMKVSTLSIAYMYL